MEAEKNLHTLIKMGLMELIIGYHTSELVEVAVALVEVVGNPVEVLAGLQ